MEEKTFSVSEQIVFLNVDCRKFKDVDVPTSLVRSVPESCTVHVISKGKVQNIRRADHSQNISNALSKSLKGIKGSFQSEDLNRCVLAQVLH